MFSLFLFFSCSYTHKTALAPALQIPINQEAQLQMLGKTSGTAKARNCFGGLYYSLYESNFVSTTPSSGNFSLVEDAAMYHALQKKILNQVRIQDISSIW